MPDQKIFFLMIKITPAEITSFTREIKQCELPKQFRGKIL